MMFNVNIIKIAGSKNFQGLLHHPACQISRRREGRNNALWNEQILLLGLAQLTGGALLDKCSDNSTQLWI